MSRAPKVHYAAFLDSSTACGLPLRWSRPDPESARTPTKDGKPIQISRIAAVVNCNSCWRTCA